MLNKDKIHNLFNVVKFNLKYISNYFFLFNHFNIYTKIDKNFFGNLLEIIIIYYCFSFFYI